MLTPCRISRSLAALLLATALFGAGPYAGADETCNSPYMGNLIKGQEDYVYVWTLGVQGLGDGSDKLVTIDVNPASKKYGKVINSVSVGARGEAHHMGFTDDRRHLWAGGLSDSRIYVFDVASNPAKAKLSKVITDLPDRTGYVMDTRGRMLVVVLLINHPGARNAQAVQDALLEWVQEGYQADCCGRR